VSVGRIRAKLCRAFKMGEAGGQIALLARHVPMQVRADMLTVPVQQGSAKMAALTGSASIREKQVTVTLVNPSLESRVAARIRFAGGAQAREARGTVLTHSDMRARNTFEKTDEVRPSSLAVKTSGQGVVVDLPRQSVAAIQIQIV
jgi:alpha-L-arabinofuranosidase